MLQMTENETQHFTKNISDMQTRNLVYSKEIY